jgi:CDP-glucose 4,6-dehydratase
VLDPLHGYLKAVQHQLAGNDEAAFNFSCDSASLTVSEVVRTACTQWDVKVSDFVEFNNSSDNLIEARSLDLNSTKSRLILGWKSNWTQEEAVQSTVSWWKNFRMLKHSPVELCNSEIARSMLAK